MKVKLRYPTYYTQREFDWLHDQGLSVDVPIDMSIKELSEMEYKKECPYLAFIESEEKGIYEIDHPDSL